MSRFEENLGNRDSLATLLNDALVLAESRLENDDRLNSAALVLAGAFVEGLYLSTMVVETYPDDLLPEESKNIMMIYGKKLDTFDPSLVAIGTFGKL